MQTSKLKVAITHGDPNGIGYETIIKSLLDIRVTDLFTPIIYGNKRCFDFWIAHLPIGSEFKYHIIENAIKAQPGKINFISVGESYDPTPSLSDIKAGQLSVEALRRATADIKLGLIDVMVTAPIDKKSTNNDDFSFVGHTEYLANEFDVQEPLMFMISERLRIGLVTMHIALDDVKKNITKETILSHLRLLNSSLLKDFSLRSAKIAVLSLNPHCGEEGLMGLEEREIITPAILEANKENISAFGPFAVDGFFGSDTYSKFDGVLAMYHDQGLAPFKALSFDRGVNFTAGLPIVRTSPAHGVGFDIAGQNIASHHSLLSAIYCAIDIHRTRLIDEQISSNPLKHYEQSYNRHHRDANVEDILPKI